MKIRIAVLLALAFAAVAQTTPPATETAEPAPAVLAPPPDEMLKRALVLLREQERLIQQQRLLVPPRPQPTPPGPPAWLLPLLIAATASSLIGAALQPILFRRSRAALQPLASAAAAQELEAQLGRVAENVQTASAAVAGRIDGATDRLAADFHRELSRLAHTIGERLPASEEPADDSVRLEHQVLAEQWKQFRETEALSPAHEATAWESLLAELTAAVPAELQPSFDAVMSPYREHRMLLQRIGIIPHVVNGEMRLASEAAELKRARELTQLLIATQRAEGRERLRFPFQRWVTDTFLPFADLYLQSYQKALFEGHDGDLRKGMTAIRQILHVASVEPIDVTLGETRFDSTRHVGRATSSDPHVPDGVITGVIRNGFIAGGQQVIRQPEVIVNRAR